MRNESDDEGDGMPSAAIQAGAVSAGTLYIVATPIGNLEDVTLRALRVLKEADLIACEDTRQTQKLLNHYAITTRKVSYHEHNEFERAQELLKELQAGRSIALVTDAGTPAVSDPGFRLIALAIHNRLPVVPIPGPSAFLLALVASGLPVDSFQFCGFLPAKHGERRAVLEAINDSGAARIFYEAPHRIVDALTDVVEVLGSSRPIVIARELTKLHEEFLRGMAGEVLETLKSRDAVKGEIVLLIGKAGPADAHAAADRSCADVSIRQRMQQIMAGEKVDEKAALKKVAKERGISKSEAYREWQRQK